MSLRGVHNWTARARGAHRGRRQRPAEGGQPTHQRLDARMNSTLEKRGHFAGSVG